MTVILWPAAALAGADRLSNLDPIRRPE